MKIVNQVITIVNSKCAVRESYCSSAIVYEVYPSHHYEALTTQTIGIANDYDWILGMFIEDMLNVLVLEGTMITAS